MRCSNCFMIYTDGDVCPKCGQSNSKEVAEPHYMKPGTELQEGRYFVGNVVGAGGFGITYAVWDNLLNRKVAIKEYLPGEFSTRLQNATKVTVYGGEKTEQFERGLEKFYEESLRLAKFNEVPGIVQIYDCFRENGTAYIVMEFLEGETLSERLKRDGKMPVEDAVPIITSVLGALDVVHKEGIIHRDIAPNNIFLCSNSAVKLIDFGAARNAAGTKNESLTVLYKEGYTAEEQYHSKGQQGPWTDVYALAATLYKMITGVVPDGAMERRRNDKLKSPRKLGIKIDANIEKAILNALNIEVKKRTQSAARFKEELTGETRVANKFVRTKEKRLVRIPSGLLIGLIVGILGIGTLTLLFYTGVIQFDLGSFASYLLGDGETHVISVVNMEEEEARAKLAEIGLELEVVDLVYTNKVQAGRIISQQEEKGAVVESGSVVHVVVSKGAGTVEVPDLVTMDWESAKVLLEELCLEYTIDTVATDSPPGYVVKQTPIKGKKIEQGQTVDVVVSAGRGYDATMVSTMVNMEGCHYKQAQDVLAQMGVYLAIEGYEYRDDVLKGGIIKQSIPEGAQVHGDDVVSVLVSLGKKPIELADDYVIDWKDENLEKKMRAKTGVRTGEITYGDVKNIKSISLESCGIRDISALGYLTNLETLYLYENNISDISALRNLTNLKYLDLSYNSISDISALRGLTDLESLYLHTNQITDISALSSLVNLKTLNLQFNVLNSIEPLSNLTKLEDLDLYLTTTSDISALSGLVRLRYLALADNGITDISALSNLTRLYHLDLTWNNISDISPLSNLTSLTEVYLAENPITDYSPVSHVRDVHYELEFY